LGFQPATATAEKRDGDLMKEEIVRFLRRQISFSAALGMGGRGFIHEKRAIQHTFGRCSGCAAQRQSVYLAAQNDDGRGDEE
jgi:hypothetical protein